MRNKQKILLKELRKRIAQNSGQSTYLVFNDKELEMLLDAQPKTIEELTSLKGFPKGGKRVTAYGSTLLNIFKSTENAGQGSPNVKAEGINRSSVF